MNASTLVQKLWNYCNVLRDDGMSCGGYLSTLLRTGSRQLTCLKLADERSRPPYGQASAIPAQCAGMALLTNACSAYGLIFA